MQQMDRKPGIFDKEDYYQLVVTHYQNLRKQQENAEYPLSEEILFKYVEKHLAELIRMGRAHKLMRKVGHIRLQQEEKE